MKGKIAVILFSLVLVFGMLAASCDNGDLPKNDKEDANTQIAYSSLDGYLPELDLKSNLPIRMGGEEILALLQEKKANGSTVVPVYKIGAVAVNPAWDATVSADKANIDLATKYLGLPIIVAIQY